MTNDVDKTNISHQSHVVHNARKTSRVELWDFHRNNKPNVRALEYCQRCQHFAHRCWEILSAYHSTNTPDQPKRISTDTNAPLQNDRSYYRNRFVRCHGIWHIVSDPWSTIEEMVHRCLRVCHGNGLSWMSRYHYNHNDSMPCGWSRRIEIGVDYHRCWSDHLCVHLSNAHTPIRVIGRCERIDQNWGHLCIYHRRKRGWKLADKEGKSFFFFIRIVIFCIFRLW